MSSDFAQSAYSQFINDAEKLKLPTALLRAVFKRYTFDTESETGEDHTTKWYHQINMKKSNYAAVNNLDFTLGVGGVINTFYHESTHAYLWMKEDDEPVKGVIERGKQYYSGQPLDDGESISDTDRIFHEAMSEYTGHRVGTFFNCMAILLAYSRNTNENASPSGISTKTSIIKSKKQEYNRYMAKRVFGYQTKGSSKVDTVQAMSSEMKIFCDQTLLEGMFSDQFDQNVRLMEVWKQLATKYPALDR